jgi:thiamine biosynthesis lipoprotein
VAAEAAAAGRATLSWHEAAMLALGTTIRLEVGHIDAGRAAAAVAAAVAAVHEVDEALSLFRGDSAIAQLNRRGVLQTPPPDLVNVLAQALGFARASAGAFDPTLQPLWRCRFDAYRAGQAPSVAASAAATALLGWRDVHLDPRRIAFARRGMALTLNGIAQGWAADRAAAALRRHGIDHALIDTGEWLPLGHSHDSGGSWRLGIAGVPGIALRADGRAVACSSDAAMSFTADRREHHVIDPRTGASPRALSQVVVLAATATRADALTKPLMLCPSAEVAIRAARAAGVDVLAVEKSGRWRASAGVPLMRA